MKTLRILVLSLLLLGFIKVNSQNTSFNLGFRTINYAELTIEKSKDSYFSYGLALNYSVSLLNSMNHTLFTTSMVRDGPGISLFFQNPLSNSKGNEIFLRVSVEYNYWQSKKLKYDEGWFSGSNTSYYAEYTENYHNIGLLISHVYYTKSKKLGYYYQAGIHGRKVDRQYLVEGSYSVNDRNESDRKEEFVKLGASLRIGVFVRLFNKI